MGSCFQWYRSDECRPTTKMTGWQGELVENGFYVSPETKTFWKEASQST